MVNYIGVVKLLEDGLSHDPPKASVDRGGIIVVGGDNNFLRKHGVFNVTRVYDVG